MSINGDFLRAVEVRLDLAEENKHGEEEDSNLDNFEVSEMETVPNRVPNRVDDEKNEIEGENLEHLEH